MALGHDDPAVQQGEGRAANPAEQPGLGARMIRRVAAGSLVVGARNQEPLIGKWTRDHSGQGLGAIAQGEVRVGRARVTENRGARTIAIGDALHELHGFVDPAVIQHCARVQEHQPGRARLTCAFGQRRRPGSLKGQESAARDIRDPFDHVSIVTIIEAQGPYPHAKTDVWIAFSHLTWEVPRPERYFLVSMAGRSKTSDLRCNIMPAPLRIIVGNRRDTAAQQSFEEVGRAGKGVVVVDSAIAIVTVIVRYVLERIIRVGTAVTPVAGRFAGPEVRGGLAADASTAAD